jgi:hypothetical protein
MSHFDSMEVEDQMEIDRNDVEMKVCLHVLIDFE